ncbi:hypothetical protein PCANC_04062 [Puccinia coronata f. sp. avenae]|uniref:Secreted protein n=1 Tax=Puccinia coronata f. sp. avenae TaxID=200324 RepID=A0A2N5W2A6_9BASI|nr:hypothetical protein PCANC_04062 [Puccinia coronata f. sp. avenae]
MRARTPSPWVLAVLVAVAFLGQTLATHKANCPYKVRKLLSTQVGSFQCRTIGCEVRVQYITQLHPGCGPLVNCPKFGRQFAEIPSLVVDRQSAGLRAAGKLANELRVAPPASAWANHCRDNRTLPVKGKTPSKAAQGDTKPRPAQLDGPSTSSGFF